MIAGGLDVHRTQMTFDYLDMESGEGRRGVIRPATRESLRRWLSELEGAKGGFVLEATTGWRFVVEELRRAGFEPHLAEPAEARARKGPKRRAKTDRADARHLRDLLISDAVPESWIPPDHIADLRTKVRLRKALVGQRTAWQERIHAQLFHHGLPPVAALLTVEGRARLEAAALPPCARQVVDVALRMIDSIDQALDPLDTELIRFARHQIGCRALMSHYGIGALTSVAILAELGDTRRFSSSRQAVRFAGLDVTVSESNGKRSRGRLSRQGPPALRWALYEAAKCAYRPQSPDHEYYLAVKERKGAQRACLSVARRLARRSHHTLAGLGDDAFAVPA